jgi:hypothetical protein
MGAAHRDQRLIKNLRWVARIWTIPILVFACGQLVAPSARGIAAGLPRDDIDMIMMGIVVLGLLLAWRWETLGGIVALLGIAAHYVVYYFMFGPSFPRLAMVILGVPAVLFMVCAGLSHPKLRTEQGNEPREDDCGGPRKSHSWG